jgi:hypothetical protein
MMARYGDIGKAEKQSGINSPLFHNHRRMMMCEISMTNKMSQAWQPIASAPFDCSVLLLTDRGVFVGIAASDDEVGKQFQGGKRWLVYDGKDEHTLCGPYPTHWQPLPVLQQPESNDG